MSSNRQRAYTADELALFARYQPAREQHQPRECSRGERCWVKLGPPGYYRGSSKGAASSYCLECRSHPR
jgi:hypothetical protein